MALNRWLRGYRGPSKEGSGGGGGGAPDPHAATHLSNGSDPIDAATASVGGLMAATDKAKLDSYAGISASVSVSTTAQATATQLTTQFNVVTGGVQFDACKLPASWPVGVPVFIWNRLGARSTTYNFIRVFPNSGETIQGYNANAAIFLACEGIGVYVKSSSTVWQPAVLSGLATSGSTEGGGRTVTEDEFFYRQASFLNGILVQGAAIQNNDGRLAFGAATTVNRILFPDNLADAFWLGEGTNHYMGFVSTNSSESIQFYKAISGYLAVVNTQTGDYSLVLTAGTGDSGKVVEIDSGTGKNLTLPATAAVGTCATVAQIGDGQITFITTGSGTIVNANSHTKTRAKYSVCSVYCRANVGGSAAVWVLSGDTAA